MTTKPAPLFLAMFLLMMLFPLAPVWAANSNSDSSSQTQQAAQSEPQALEGQSPATASGSGSVNISSGLPVVTTQQAIAKSQRVTGQVYELIRNVAPHLVLIAICIAAVLSVFWRPARVSILVILLGYAVIEWGPQLVSWFQGLLHA